MTQNRGSLDPPVPKGTGAAITALDIQQKEFRVSRLGGYRMRDVDEFLDRLTEVVSTLTEENARLRRQAGAAPVLGSPDLEDVARQADEIIQRARDEAARIDAESRARVAGGSAGSEMIASDADRAAVKAFLAQERTFLESLAGLVQGHAESVKGMARSARRRSPATTDTTETAPADDAPEPPAPPVGEREGSDEDAIVEVGDAEPTQALPSAEASGELAPTRRAQSGTRKEPGGGEGDPSLRDLFWGEEG